METATEKAEVAVPVTGVTEGTAPDPDAAVAPEVVLEAHVEAHSGASIEVEVRKPEIEDVAPIHSTSMVEVTSTSRGGLELLADDLVDSAIVDRNL
jgi:hypothetical protein